MSCTEPGTGPLMLGWGKGMVPRPFGFGKMTMPNVFAPETFTPEDSRGSRKVCSVIRKCFISRLGVLLVGNCIAFGFVDSIDSSEVSEGVRATQDPIDGLKEMCRIA